MRLSRTRVLLRVALLTVGGAFLWARAWQSWRGAAEVEGGAAALSARLALVFGLMGLLALVTALVAGLSLRRRRRAPTLRLGANPSPPAGLSPGERRPPP